MAGTAFASIGATGGMTGSRIGPHAGTRLSRRERRSSPPMVTAFGNLRPYRRAWLARDVTAGITLAALAIPEVMGYTKISGTPVITGLYTLLIPVVVFAAFGS